MNKTTNRPLVTDALISAWRSTL